MKDKKFKYYEDVIEEYLQLTDEQIEIPLLIEKNKEKMDSLNLDKNNAVLKAGDAEDAYKIFTQIKKLEDRRAEVETELKEVENFFKQFLQVIDGGKVSFQKKDDNDKSKITYLFWLEDGEIKSNR